MVHDSKSFCFFFYMALGVLEILIVDLLLLRRKLISMIILKGNRLSRRQTIEVATKKSTRRQPTRLQVITP